MWELRFFLFSKDNILEKKLLFKKNKYNIIMLEIQTQKIQASQFMKITSYTWN